jgi:AraC-like DNA-binding protein
MIFQKFKPTEYLQQYIDCYYLIEGEYLDKVSDIFFPDGCIEVVFNVDWEFYRNEQKESWAKVIGQITEPLKVQAKGKGKCFGIWFLPHTFSLFSSIPLTELNDKSLALENIFSPDFIDLVGEYLHENKIQKLVESVDSFLIKSIKKSTHELKDKVANYAVRSIFINKGQANLELIAKDCNISSRYLQKIFLEKIGFNPKFLVRIVRFQQALDYVQFLQNNSLTNIAYQSGYFDQAHFIKEFKDFTSFVPSQYRIENHPINQYFLNS